MPLKKILAFSSSRSGNSGYLEKALPVLEKFLGNKERMIAFIPFASVDSYEEYCEKVRKALENLPYKIRVVLPENGKSLIAKSDCIMVGGGNTFKLLHDLYDLDLMEIIREKVNAGTPYIGWSAGSNILGTSILTTNDMPIIQPKSFQALSILPFLINPHYYNETIEGFNGETRDTRLQECLKVNPSSSVLALPEGSAITLQSFNLQFIENGPGYVFKNQEGDIQKRVILSSTSINYLLGEVS